MKLNLQRFNASYLKLDVATKLSQDEVVNLINCFSGKVKKSLIESQNKKKELFFLFGRDYVVAKKKHYARAFIHTIKKENYHIVIEYSLKDPIEGYEYEHSLPPINELVGCLSVKKQESIFDVMARFEYSGKKYQTATVPLPLRLETEEFFNEIRGVRLTKTKDDNILYTVVVDRPENKTIHNTVAFQYTGQFNKDLPENALQYASQISGKAINET